MAHTLNVWGGIIGIFAAIAWFASAVCAISGLVLSQGGQDALNNDVVRWIQDSENARQRAGFLNTVAAGLTSVSAGFLSWAAIISP